MEGGPAVSPEGSRGRLLRDSETPDARARKGIMVNCGKAVVLSVPVGKKAESCVLTWFVN